MAQFILSVIVILVVLFGVFLPACAYLIFLERKVAAWIQDRVGPNRTNFSFGLFNFKGRHLGLGQALADGLKLIFKEDYTPPNVEKVLFILAPVIAVGTAILGWAVIPWGGRLIWNGEPLLVVGAPLNVGIIYILAIGSLSVYGVVLGGYASNNKYSFLGGLRAAAQMLSYEVPLAMCVLIMVLTYGTLRPETITELQLGWFNWGIFAHPLLAVIFFTCALAETNRAPFDLAEAEQELVGGFHTEYASMKWALFFLGEYMHMITGCAFFALLFLGGWDPAPLGQWLPIALEDMSGVGLALLKAAIFFGKVAFLLFVMMWVRWTLPRFRFDQLMRLAWRGLIPITLAILLASAVLVYYGAPRWTFLIANIAIAFITAVIGPMIPEKAPVNRRVPLAGSRFSPLEPAS